MYRNVEELIGKKKASATGCLKAKNGEIIMEKDKILERWSEYIKELFDDERKEIEVMKGNFAGPPILKDEVRTAIWKMKNGKATGPDNIAAEQIKALDEFGINKITVLLDEIYETGEIPKEMLKSIFIALPKKDGATECELHRTISLISQVTKILLRIVMMRVRNKIRPEIGDTQCGFVEGKGTTNAVYMLRMIIERALEMQKDIYLCFIDYTKAFDRVKHWEMIKQLKQLHVDGKDLRIIKNIYWQQIAAVRIENEISPFQMIKRGVRQGCVLSPDLFNLYSETTLRNLDEYPGIRIGGRIINNLRYADDTVLIAENKEDLQKLIDIAATESKRMGLELNNKKTEVMGEAEEWRKVFYLCSGIAIAGLLFFLVFADGELQAWAVPRELEVTQEVMADMDSAKAPLSQVEVLETSNGQDATQYMASGEKPNDSRVIRLRDEI
ncbi:endonuclease-reverse transcriptase [Plakobranchus ocellatus]|uniref:Endonuclease-reverse transcriptase n=1 Tax=Plakobranchus ocellatus TaxID=259542 RepID=A0AAV4BBJ0_9GAST|nr:endonuclease-reverse transcriptase [Plakobranchus ocellatus]